MSQECVYGSLRRKRHVRNIKARLEIRYEKAEWKYSDVNENW